MTPQSPAPVAGRPLTAEADPIEPCGGCGETNPSRRCLGCLHDFVSRPASDQPVEASGAGREELVADLHRRADACHDLMKPGLSTRDAMRLHGKEAAYRHAAHLVNAALSPASPARPELTVWYGKMPESNGRENWTAVLRRVNPTDKWDQGFCFARSEYPGRVLYEADRVRWIIGERVERPDILAYDEDAHSGYVEPASPARTPMGDVSGEDLLAISKLVGEYAGSTAFDAWQRIKAVLSGAETDPVPVTVFCPVCAVPHVDEDEWATTRHHKTHQCQGCGHEWRPFPFATVGVQHPAAPTPMGGGVEALREALERIAHMRVELTGTPVDSEAANAWAITLDAAADIARQALAASPQPEAGEAVALREAHTELVACSEYLEPLIDADGDSEGFYPNREMTLKSGVDRAIEMIEGRLALPSVQPVEGK